MSSSLWHHGLQHARPLCPSLSQQISQSLPKLMYIASVMPSSHLILWHPLLLLPSIIPSIKDFSNESAVRIRWPKYWNFSFSISPCNEYSGLISLKIAWFDLLAVQGTLRSLLQHHSSKASILWRSALFTAVSHRLLQYYIFWLVYFLKECFSNYLIPCLAKKKNHTLLLNLESSLASFKSLFLRFFSVFSLEEIRSEHI